MTPAERPSQVITFYSYKGGTGRSMALANTACLLAKEVAKPKRVLAVDWDLDAPGLDRFFGGHLGGVSRRVIAEQPGLLDLFELIGSRLGDARTVRKESMEEAQALWGGLSLTDFVVRTDVDSLDLLRAGRLDDNYQARVSAYQWEALYKGSPGLFRALAERLGEDYEYVLIDSRTGLSDIGGVCTMLMPEKLVIAFTPNEQSIEGALGLVRRALRYRKNSDDLRPLMVFPVPSRVELAEPELREVWRRGGGSRQIVGYQPQFEMLFKEMYGLAGCDLTAYFDEVQLQHVPRYSYGEELAVVHDTSQDRLSLGSSYRKLAGRLLDPAAPWEPTTIEQVSNLVRAGISAREEGKYPESEQLLKQALRAAEGRMGPDNPNVGSALGQLAALYSAQGRLSDAEALYLRALASYESAFGPDTLPVAVILNNLALQYRASAKYHQAEAALKRAIGIERRFRGPHHPDFAASLSNLAALEMTLGKYAEAERTARDALAIAETGLGQRDPRLANILNTLASACAYLGKRDEAEALYKRALELIESDTRSSDSLERLAAIRSSLADLYIERGDRALAEPLLKSSIEALEKLSPDHPNLATVLDNLGKVYFQDDRMGEAARLWQRALGIRERNLGPDHPDMANSLSNIAQVFMRQGAFSKAEPLLRRVLEVRRKVQGEDHPDVANALNNFAIALYEQGKHEEAVAKMQEALGIVEKRLGPGHPNVAGYLENYAALLESLGRTQEAASLQARAKTIMSTPTVFQTPEEAGERSPLRLKPPDVG